MGKFAMQGSRRWIAAAFLLSAVIFAPALAWADPGMLTGTVKGTDGHPKSFARVQLQGSAIYAAVCDVAGKFTITKFTTGGTYQITVRQGDNVETQTQQIGSLSLPIVVHF
jgi:hypothetical protein